uniref:Single domain-containing protein n=1 Tax=Arion vulgaris TaxID=1028688 RepID=A0A0B6ZW91_9EUPU
MIATKIIAAVVLIAAVCNIAQAECELDGIEYEDGSPIETFELCYTLECVASRIKMTARPCELFERGAVCKDGSAPKLLKLDDCCRSCEDGSYPKVP